LLRLGRMFLIIDEGAPPARRLRPISAQTPIQSDHSTCDFIYPRYTRDSRSPHGAQHAGCFRARTYAHCHASRQDTGSDWRNLRDETRIRQVIRRLTFSRPFTRRRWRAQIENQSLKSERKLHTLEPDDHSAAVARPTPLAHILPVEWKLRRRTHFRTTASPEEQKLCD